MPDNYLYYGDNLDILRRYVKDESVDLVYLDPPFNSNANYNVLFAEKDGKRSAAQIKAFTDTWQWDEASASMLWEVIQRGGQPAHAMQAFRILLGENDMLAYLAMMAPRLIELHRVLKPTGSIYLHCDSTASHYLKILMDGIFGPRNFRNEIIWRRTNAHNKLTRQYGPIHDTILFYAKSDAAPFHPGVRPYSKAYINDRFTHEDELGRFQTNYLTGPGTRNGESGLPWRGFNPTAAGCHWAVPKSLRQFLPNEGAGMSSHEQLELLYSQGFIVFPKKEGGQPMYKQYIGQGVPYQDIWAYQPNTRGVLHGSDECIDEDVKYLEDEDEKLGYDTQKPEGLLARILVTSTDEGDVVLDPFCGCGTAIAAAQKLGRRWIGIDITHVAVGLMKSRLRDAFGLQENREYKVTGEPTTLPDAEKLAAEDKFQFQAWALGKVGARNAESAKKGADKGIDGRLYFHEGDNKPRQVILSVKGGHLRADDIRALGQVVTRENADIGVLITMEPPTQPMRGDAASGGFYVSPWGKHPRLQILTIKELLDGKKIDMPQTYGANITFRQAPRAKAAVGASAPSIWDAANGADDMDEMGVDEGDE